MNIHSFLQAIKHETGLKIEDYTIFEILKACINEMKKHASDNGEINIESLRTDLKHHEIAEMDKTNSRKVNEPEIFYVKSTQSEESNSFISNTNKPFKFDDGINHFMDKQYVIKSVSNKTNSKELFTTLVQTTGLPIHFLADDVFEITPKTFSRYKNEDRDVPLLITELAIKIIELYKLGIELFGSNKAFNAWLMEYHPAMNDEKPVAYLSTSTGIDLLFEELKRIEFGATA